MKISGINSQRAASGILTPFFLYFTFHLLDVAAGRIPNGTRQTLNSAVPRADNQTIGAEPSNITSINVTLSGGQNQTFSPIPSTIAPAEIIHNVTDGRSWDTYTDQQWTPSDSDTNTTVNRTLTTVDTVNNGTTTTNGSLDYPKSPPVPPQSVSLDTWLTGPGGGLNPVSTGVLDPQQSATTESATTESASTGARLPASPDNTTQFLPSNDAEPPPARGGNLPHPPIGHGLGHKPINYPAMHVYRRLKDSADSSGAEIIAIFGLILCILFIVCIFTVDLSTVRRDIKRIRYRRLGRSIHLDNLDSVEVTEGWQRL